MATALVALANTTLTGAVTGITFSSITTGYKDYLLVCQIKGTLAANINIRLNGDTAGNYSYVSMSGDGTTASGSQTTATTFLTPPIGADTTTDLIRYYHFVDASATDKFKSVLMSSDRAAAGTARAYGVWSSTSAISSIYIYAQSNMLASGTTLALYGVLA